MIEQTYKLNMIPRAEQDFRSYEPPVVHISQYDKVLRTLRFELYDGENPFTIPENTAAYIYGMKPDGNAFQYQMDITEDGLLQIDVQTQMATVAGCVTCEVILFEGNESGNRIGSANFKMAVEKAAVGDDAQFSESDMPVIQTLLFGGTPGDILVKDEDGVKWNSESLSVGYMRYDQYDPDRTGTVNSARQANNAATVDGHTVARNVLANEYTNEQIDESFRSVREEISDLDSVAVKSVNSIQPDQNGNVQISKADIGLGNVDNTSDADKPISSAAQEALNQKVDKVPGMGLSQNSFTDTEKEKLGALPTSAELTAELSEKVDKEAGKGLSTNDFTNAEKTKLAGIEAGAQVNTITGVKGDAETDYRTGNVNITKENIGLGNVDNTSDLDKPISTATQEALDLKQNTLTFDTTPTAGSTNPVTSDGIAAEISALNSNLTSLEDEVDSIGTATSIEETEPYLFKSSARDNAVGNIMSVHKIIGGTVAWNQLFVPQTRAASGVTMQIGEDGYVVLNGTASSTLWLQMQETGRPIVGHKYFADTGTNDNTILFTNDGKGISTLYGNRYTIGDPTTNQYMYFTARAETTFDNLKLRPQFIDLTQMFGSTIADYIYSLEQATEGAGVAWFKKLFPNDYYPYNAGELISVKTSAHVMRDANSNIIGNYPLDPDLELRGIPKIADGKLYYDGDEYEPSGTVTRKYGIVDLGTLTWAKVSGSTSQYDYYFAPLTSQGVWSTGNVVCSQYVGASALSPTAGSNGEIRIVNGNEVRVRDLSYSDATTFKTAMSGVYLVYELATPTTETADAYDKQQVFDVTGTEEYVDTRTVPISVGHDTFFPTSLTSRIDALEDEFNEGINSLAGSLAMIETSPATANHAIGSYLMLNNRLCKVTSPIATGEQIIVGSNVQYTTVAEELSAILAQINA